MANSGATDRAAHDHLFHVPEPLEKLFSELDRLDAVAGEGLRREIAAVRALVQEALAAQARGEVARAVAAITRGMQAMAALARGIDPNEASEMGAVARQFGRALLRGDAGEASAAADVMRARSGAKVVKGG